MKLFAHLPLKSTSKRLGRRMSNYHSAWFTAVRLYGPERLIAGRLAIMVDIEIPAEWRGYVLDSGWRPDGTYRIDVVTNVHGKTLAPFLASGDLEWDVRGTP